MKASAKDRLWYWLIGQKNTGNDIILTSSILFWGLTHFSNRACRNARNLCAEGKIRRIPKSEALAMGLHTKEMAYKIL